MSPATAVRATRGANRHRVRAILMKLLLLLCVALTVTGATALLGIQTIRDDVTTTRTTITPLVDTSHEVRSTLLRAQAAVRGYVLTEDPSFAQEYQRAAADLLNARTRLTSLADGRLDQLGPLNTAIDDWLGDTRPVAVTASPASLDLENSAESMNRGLDALGRLDRDVSDLREQGRADLRWSLNAAALAVLVVTALSVGAVLLALRRVDRLLALPLLRLQQTVVRQREGDSSARASTSVGAVEVVDLARSFNEFTDEARTRLIDVARSFNEHSAAVRELAEQRQQALDQLQELDRQKSEFLSTTNHELRTPLTSISGYLEMLEDGDFGELGAEQRHAVGIAQRNTLRLQLLIEDVLLINRMDQGPQRQRCERVDLAECLDAVLVNLAPQAARGQVRLGAGPGGPWPVEGDQERLERAITNVVSNAVKFTPPGGAVELTWSTAGEGSVVQLHCTDTGMGIPAQDLDKLFTSFTRASNATAQQVPGTGLGLVIVRTIVEQHGGHVHLDSVEGEGTHVVLELPLAEGAQAGGAQASGEQAGGETVGSAPATG
ncbi:ATP-binding protein [Kocuria sp. M1N1S27]|uniref:sensor histidine kinase n=1 Tax=Kocuria kalidii TaxID=3376283 RepID=UPI0037AD2428